MTMKRITGLFTILLLAVPLASTPAKADPVGRDMGCSPTVANPCSGGSSGGGSRGNSSGSELGSAIGQALGQAIGNAIRGNPEEDARRKAQAELRAEEQRRAVEEANRKL